MTDEDKLNKEKIHRSFKEKGGFELDLHMKREAMDDPFSEVPPAKEMTVFLRQHIGPEPDPIVDIGDEVRYGQKIGGYEDPEQEWAVPVHSPVNGIVKEIKQMEHPVSGNQERAIVIETEDDEKEPFYDPIDPEEASREELLERVKEAGVVGLGGAICPTHVKLSQAKDRVSHLIINAKESDPNVACDVRLMIEKPKKMIDGMKLMAHIIGADNIVFATRTQEGEIPEFERLLKKENIDIARVRPNYSIGYGRLLVTEILNKEVPHDEHSVDVGALVHNVGTAYAISKAIREGESLVSRGLTYYSKDIGGKNLWTRIGTPVSQVLDFVDAPARDFERVALGSIMMGSSISDPSVPLLKAHAGVTGFMEDEPHPYEDKTWCIRCGYCNTVCPMDLYPQLIMKAEKKGDKKRLEKLKVDACMDCGLCSFVCPARINYKPILRRAKSEMWESEN